jgi:hypothetical protein
MMWSWHTAQWYRTLAYHVQGPGLIPRVDDTMPV